MRNFLLHYAYRFENDIVARPHKGNCKRRFEIRDRLSINGIISLFLVTKCWNMSLEFVRAVARKY